MEWARFCSNTYLHGGNGRLYWHKLFEGQLGKRSISIKIPFSSEIPLQINFFLQTHPHKRSVIYG